jgi:hypothetical protein
MTRKHWTVVAAIILLAAFSLYLNRDWFARDDIQIFHRSRPARPGLFAARRKSDPAFSFNPIMFGFNRKLKITSLKVISLDELATNKYPHPLWHLVTESNSVPTREIIYGDKVKGMHPDIKGATPEDLTPGAGYRLLLEAGDLKAQHDFQPVARPQ